MPSNYIVSENPVNITNPTLSVSVEKLNSGDIETSKEHLITCIRQIISNSFFPKGDKIYDKLYFNNRDVRENSAIYNILKFLQSLILKSFIYQNIEELTEQLKEVLGGALVDPNFKSAIDKILPISTLIKEIKNQEEPPEYLHCMYANLSVLIIKVNKFLEKEFLEEEQNNATSEDAAYISEEIDTINKKLIEKYNKK